jgi:hypothetical protein
MQAAEHFAAIFWAQPRKVGEWMNREDGKLRFKIADGVKWYLVVSMGPSGWEVVDAD